MLDVAAESKPASKGMIMSCQGKGLNRLHACKGGCCFVDIIVNTCFDHSHTLSSLFLLTFFGSIWIQVHGSFDSAG